MQPRLRLAQVGTAQEEIGGDIRGNLHHGRRYGRAPIDARLVDLARRAAEEEREGAFLAHAREAQHRHQRLAGAKVRLDLAILELGCDAGVEAKLLQVERLLPPEERALRDLDAPVEGLQREVAARHVGDERGAHGVPPRLAREELGTCRFARAPVLAPEIDLPGEAQHQAVVVGDRLGRDR